MIAKKGAQSYLPEPLDDGMIWAVTVFVDGVLSPVIDIDVTEAAHQ